MDDRFYYLFKMIYKSEKKDMNEVHYTKKELFPKRKF